MNTQPEEWESKEAALKEDFLSLHYEKFSSHNDMVSVWSWFVVYMKSIHITKADEIRKAEEKSYNQAINDAVGALPVIDMPYIATDTSRANFTGRNEAIEEAVSNLEALKK